MQFFNLQTRINNSTIISVVNVFKSLNVFMKLSFYADHGYRHVGFRMVKDTSMNSLEMDSSNQKYENPLLNYWNLKPIDK